MQSDHKTPKKIKEGQMTNSQFQKKSKEFLKTNIDWYYIGRDWERCSKKCVLNNWLDWWKCISEIDIKVNITRSLRFIGTKVIGE